MTKTERRRKKRLKQLLRKFEPVLLAKMLANERKYKFNDGWRLNDWKESLQRKMLEHVAKGDPRDTAILSLFAWHHGWPVGVPVAPNEQEGQQEQYNADFGGYDTYYKQRSILEKTVAAIEKLPREPGAPRLVEVFDSMNMPYGLSPSPGNPLHERSERFRESDQIKELLGSAMANSEEYYFIFDKIEYYTFEGMKLRRWKRSESTADGEDQIVCT